MAEIHIPDTDLPTHPATTHATLLHPLLQPLQLYWLIPPERYRRAHYCIYPILVIIKRSLIPRLLQKTPSILRNVYLRYIRIDNPGQRAPHLRRNDITQSAIHAPSLIVQRRTRGGAAAAGSWAGRAVEISGHAVGSGWMRGVCSGRWGGVGVFLR